MVLKATLGTPICPWLCSTLVMGEAVEPNLWEGPVLDQHRGRTQASQLVQRDKGYREGQDEGKPKQLVDFSPKNEPRSWIPKTNAPNQPERL